MPATRTRRTGTEPTEVVPAGRLVEQARLHASDGSINRITAALDNTTQRLVNVGGAGQPTTLIETLGAQLAAALENDADATLPAEYSQRVATAITEHEQRINESKILEHARRILQDRLADTKRHSTNGALTHLNDHLHQIMAVARDLIAVLPGITTADQALATGTPSAEAWRRAGVLAEPPGFFRTL
ncbi:MAG TPA: hypothetical protein VIU87_19115, partial [Mycobacterium sp.]